MRSVPTLTYLALCASFSSAAAAQNTVVSTRTFTNEAFELANWQGNFFGPIELYGLGLDDHAYTHGTPTLIEIQLDVEWDIDVAITSELTYTDSFCYTAPMVLSPVVGDCQGYVQFNLNESTAPVSPGGTAVLQIQRVDTLSWTGSTFQTACSAPWTWDRLNLWSDPFFPSPFNVGCGSQSVPFEWMQVNRARAILNGTIRVTWAPNLLPSQTICAGSASPAVTLQPYGGVDLSPNVYLIQEGAPNSTNLLVEADQATSVVQPSGLCVSGSIRRVPGSLSQGGTPFRLPEAGALIGATTYFQSWFRTGAGTSGTSECIEVSFP